MKYCWDRCTHNFRSQNKSIVVLPCGVLVDSNTFLKCLTGCTDGGGYENHHVYVVIIIKTKAMKSLCWLF